MIAKCESLIRAEKVLGFIRPFTKGLQFDLHLGVWSNGREQGFYLCRMEGAPETWPALVWAQYRTSDSTVVVFGAYHQFDMTTHTPHEDLWGGEAYGHMKFFPPGKEQDAAKFIADYMTYYPLKEIQREEPLLRVR